MFSKAKSFVKNHWKKVLYAGITVQAVSYGFQYATKRLLQHHQDQAKEVWLQMKKREHFDKIHANSLSTFFSLLPQLKQKIEKCLNSEALTASLKLKGTNKLQVWEELKIIAFSRMLATIYGSSILCILLNVQLSIIGGYLIQDSCSKKIGSDSDPSSSSSSSSRGSTSNNGMNIDTELQNEFLSLSDYFVKDGIEKLCSLIYNETKRVVGPISLKRKLTFNDMEQILWHIVELLKTNNNGDNENSLDDDDDDNTSNPVKNSWKYIFPPRILEQYGYFRVWHPNYYRRSGSSAATNMNNVDMEELIMTETYDLLKSQDVEFLIKSFETFGVSSFLDRLMDVAAQTATPTTPVTTTTTTKNGQISENDNNNSSSSTNSSVSNNTSSQEEANSSTASTSSSFPSQTYILPHEVAIPVAKLIPLVNSFFPSTLNPSDPWITSITQAEKLRDFSANVYESFSTPVAF